MPKKNSLTKEAASWLAVIKERLGQFPLSLVKKPFLTALALIILGLLLSGLVFYRYAIFPQETLPQPSARPLLFNEQDYLRLLEERP